MNLPDGSYFGKIVDVLAHRIVFDPETWTLTASPVDLYPQLYGVAFTSGTMTEFSHGESPASAVTEDGTWDVPYPGAVAASQTFTDIIDIGAKQSSVDGYEIDVSHGTVTFIKEFNSVTPGRPQVTWTEPKA